MRLPAVYDDDIAASIDEALRPPLTPTAVQVVQDTDAYFEPSFPGWALYCRIVHGDTSVDEVLGRWVCTMADALVRAKVGRSHVPYVVARGAHEWAHVAALDALATVVHGHPPEPAKARYTRYGVHADTWRKVYRPIRAGVACGFASYRWVLHMTWLRQAGRMTAWPVLGEYLRREELRP